MKKGMILLLLLPVWSLSLFGGGYQVRLQGQKQTGIGLIGTPFAWDASSMFYNPGGLALYEGKFSFSAGVSPIFANQVFQMSGTNYQARTDNPVSTPFYFYGAGKIMDYLAVGIAVYTPYGSTAQWEDKWAGRYLVQDISLQAIFIQPTVAFQYKDKFGIGAGFVYAMGNFELNKYLPYNENSTVNLQGKGNSIGFNAGVFVRPVEDLTIGLSFRSKIVMEVDDGDATFVVPGSLSTTIPEENTFSAELPLPANLEFGLAYRFSEKFLLAAEINWVQWSAYDSLNFTFENNGEMLNSQNPRKYENRVIPRLGAEYRLNDKFAFRAGIYYDQTPTNEDYFSPETISLNTIAFTLGMSLNPIKGLSIDLSYLQLNGMEADKTYLPAEFSGKYKSVACIPGIGLTYQF